MALSIARTKRDIKRLRLERSLLLEKLEERTLLHVDDSDGTPSPPSSPGKAIGSLSQEMLEAAAATAAASAQQLIQQAAAASVANSMATANANGGSSSTPSSKRSSNRGGARSRKSNAEKAAAATAEKAEGKTNGTSKSKDSNNNANNNGDTSNGEDDLTSTPATGKAKRQHTPRDPNLPRRPQNAYIIFCEMEKEQVKSRMEKENPGLPYDLTKAMSDAWHNLPEPDRKKYYKVYEDDKERYMREMAAYSPPNPTPSAQRERIKFQKALEEHMAKKSKKAETPTKVKKEKKEDGDGDASGSEGDDEEEDDDVLNDLDGDDHNPPHVGSDIDEKTNEDHHDEEAETTIAPTNEQHDDEDEEMKDEDDEDNEDNDDEEDEEDDDKPRETESKDSETSAATTHLGDPSTETGLSEQVKEEEGDAPDME